MKLLDCARRTAKRALRIRDPVGGCPEGTARLVTHFSPHHHSARQDSSLGLSCRSRLIGRGGQLTGNQGAAFGWAGAQRDAAGVARSGQEIWNRERLAEVMLRGLYLRPAPSTSG